MFDPYQFTTISANLCMMVVGLCDWMDGRPEEMTLWNTMINKQNSWIDGTLSLRPNMNILS